MTYKELAVFLAYNGTYLSPNVVIGLDEVKDKIIIHTCHYSYESSMAKIIDMKVQFGNLIIRHHNTEALKIDLSY